VQSLQLTVCRSAEPVYPIAKVRRRRFRPFLLLMPV